VLTFETHDRGHEVGNECIEGKSKKNKKTKFSIKKYWVMKLEFLKKNQWKKNKSTCKPRGNGHRTDNKKNEIKKKHEDQLKKLNVEG
jgi:hypothetical protein